MNAVNAVAIKEPTWREKLAYLSREMGALPQRDCPLKHYFAPHVYVREIFMPADSIVIGKIHKTEHFNIIQKGSATLISEDGSRKLLEAPYTFVSKGGVQKVLYIHEDMVWSTIHITENRDLESLEAELIEPDESYPIFNRAKERFDIAREKNVLALLEE